MQEAGSRSIPHTACAALVPIYGGISRAGNLPGGPWLVLCWSFPNPQLLTSCFPGTDGM